MSSPTAGALGANLSWSKVDVLTSFQRLSAEIQVRGGRLRETINDPEPLFHMRNVSAEPAPPDLVAEMIRRYVMFQATTFMVTGAAEFPKATEPTMHTEILMKSRFFAMLDVTITIFGVNGKSWTQPNIWVNRDLMLAVFLG